MTVAIEFLCARRNHRIRFVRLLRNDYRNIRLEDARLFACNRRNSSAEICFMIERNRSDDAEMRLNDVRCIETAAQSNFNHGHICFTLECKKRHSRHRFEVRRVRVKFPRSTIASAVP